MNDYIRTESGAFVHRMANIVGDVQIGENTRIDAFVTITGKTVIGKRVHVSANCAFLGGGGIVIGDGAGFSSGVKVYSGTSDIESGMFSNPMLRERRVMYGSVYLGELAHFGANAVILPGVTVGYGSVIGALSMVRSNVPDMQIWAGVPAKYLRDMPAINVKAMLGDA